MNRIKITVTLPDELLAQIDQFTDGEQDLSTFLETAARAYMTRRIRRAEQNARDLEIINANAEYLNSEARDVSELVAALYTTTDFDRN